MNNDSVSRRPLDTNTFGGGTIVSVITSLVALFSSRGSAPFIAGFALALIAYGFLSFWAFTRERNRCFGSIWGVLAGGCGVVVLVGLGM